MIRHSEQRKLSLEVYCAVLPYIYWQPVKSELVEFLPYPVLSETKHILCGVHALPGGSPLSGKRTESARAFGQLMWLRLDLIEVSPGHFDPGPLTANLTGSARKLQVGL